MVLFEGIVGRHDLVHVNGSQGTRRRRIGIKLQRLQQFPAAPIQLRKLAITIESFSRRNGRRIGRLSNGTME